MTSAGSPQNNVPFTVSATVGSIASQGAISGTVSFTVNGVTQIAVVVSGTASTTFTLPTGKYSVIANYSGNSYYLASTNTLAVQVIPAGTSAVSLTVTAPSGSITYGQAIVVKAGITTGNATATPTGFVTFTVDGGSPQTLPYATSVSNTFAPVNAGSHVLAAAFSGDNAYAPSNTAVTIAVLKASPVASLTVASNVSSVANTYTLKASVSATFGTPSGTVVFAVGTTALGSAPIVNGVASLTTTTSTFASYAFTALYSGDANFVSTTFSASPSPDFVVGLSDSALSVPQYGIGLDYVFLSAFYGYRGSLQITCTGLPANSLCRPTPLSTATSPGTTQSVQLQIFLDVNPATASLEHGPRSRAARIASGFALCVLLGFPAARSRRRMHKVFGAFAALLLSLQLSGCASNTANAPVYATPTGAYQVTVSASDGQTTHSSILSLTVLPGSPTRP